MAEVLHFSTLQLLFGSFVLSLLQIISDDCKYVHPGENITLHCNITNYSNIFWYRLRSEELEQLISAGRTKLDKHFYVDYNVDESHFDATESNSSVSLVIIAVRETDLAVYFCGARNDTTHTQFGKVIRLNVTDNVTKYFNAEEPAGPGLYWITDLIIYCVCVVSVLMNIILMCTFCCKVQRKSVSSYSSCSNTTDSSEKKENINYASIKHNRRFRAKDKRSTVSDLDSVAYAAIASEPKRN
ncbi:uncharacterized protein Hap1MRO34_017951 isoform 2-T2 [Clarias gariepinus]|uniref:uncharacterized protein LOC128541686 isoform X2 n=1 Tax=Clarias gariepinus TaxID=13013 RepID=UPI00234DD99F|nr:uncharacterized protein LOC128541686 isoform X2 [Clarias gariepinus]